MKTILNVVAAVIVRKGKIFCAQRGNHQSLPGLWEFPGGKIEENETPIQALKREISEELQCTIKVGRQIEQTVYEYDFAVVHLTTYYSRLILGEPQLIEHIATKWLRPSELKQLDWASADIPTVNKLIKEMNFTNETSS